MVLYVQDILMRDEKILHYAKVHYIVYLTGVTMLLLAVACIYFADPLSGFLGLSQETAQNLRRIAKFISFSLFIAGVISVLRAWLKIYSTEVVITDKRVIIKVGVGTATTAEVDRRRISSVVILKSFTGRVLDYGWINIMSYSGNITGLPPLANPHEIQKHIYQNEVAAAPV